ncbi:MAG: hypothetical protein IT373_09520 [Polyangiaceae bacterium]|nr:hypothetical protein [Polyangiaceae bacterium]
MLKLLLAIALLAATGCARGPEWPSAQPQSIHLTRPSAVMYEGALKTFRMSGYRILIEDPSRMYIQVQSLADGDAVVGPVSNIVLRISQLNFQFENDNSLIVTVAGYHVRQGKLDPRVADEVAQILNAMVNNAPATATPAPPATALPRTPASVETSSAAAAP